LKLKLIFEKVFLIRLFRVSVVLLLENQYSLRYDIGALAAIVMPRNFLNKGLITISVTNTCPAKNFSYIPDNTLIRSPKLSLWAPKAEALDSSPFKKKWTGKKLFY